MSTRAVEALALLLPYIQWKKLPEEVQDAVMCAFMDPDNYATRKRGEHYRTVPEMVEKPSRAVSGTIRATALKLAAEHGAGVNAYLLSEATGATKPVTSSTLCGLHHEGKLRRVAPGIYKLPE